MEDKTIESIEFIGWLPLPLCQGQFVLHDFGESNHSKNSFGPTNTQLYTNDSVSLRLHKHILLLLLLPLLLLKLEIVFYHSITPLHHLVTWYFHFVRRVSYRCVQFFCALCATRCSDSLWYHFQNPLFLFSFRFSYWEMRSDMRWLLFITGKRLHTVLRAYRTNYQFSSKGYWPLWFDYLWPIYWLVCPSIAADFAFEAVNIGALPSSSYGGLRLYFIQR